ncbi:MAG: hypothetical protein LBJ16_01870 [Holosporaceae bacterium]|jgi:hypothetical protein|nr:hypothetical protein [Holosporaceae bacterium]
MTKVLLYFPLFFIAIHCIAETEVSETSSKKKSETDTATKTTITKADLARMVAKGVNFVDKNFSLFNDPHQDGASHPGEDGKNNDDNDDDDAENEDEDEDDEDEDEESQKNLPKKHGILLSEIIKTLTRAIGKNQYCSPAGTPLATHIAAVAYIVIGLRVDPDSIIDSVRLSMFSLQKFGARSEDDRKLIAKTCGLIIGGDDMNSILSCVTTFPSVGRNTFYKKMKPHLVKLCYVMLGRNEDNTADIPGFFDQDLTKSVDIIHQYLKKMQKLNLASAIYCPIYALLFKFKNELSKKPTPSRKKILDALKKDASLGDIVKSIRASIDFYKIYNKTYAEFLLSVIWDSLNETVIRDIHRIRDSKWSDGNDDDIDRNVRGALSDLLQFFFDEKFVPDGSGASEKQKVISDTMDLVANVDAAICSEKSDKPDKVDKSDKSDKAEKVDKKDKSKQQKS